ncbi:MAG: GNAT family N-acetyltransferase [Promethearchaeota archaeon]|jgi:ribosomal protein S18 acetylase RimI-like enzyme
MKSEKQIKRFQEFLINSWPARHYFFLNGWILRFNEGVTSRANSVFPINYNESQKTLNEDINIVEKAYKTYNLPPVFTMHEFYEPKNLKDKLLERGYHTYDHTHALGSPINDIQAKSLNKEFEFIISNSREQEISDFLAKFSKWNEQEQNIIQKINNRIKVPKKCYVLTKYQNEVIGTLLAVLMPQGYLYIGDVFVHPNYRRRNVATSMLVKLIHDWKASKGVKTIWLQVEDKNRIALNLYNKLGMKKLYSYYYMKKS